MAKKKETGFLSFLEDKYKEYIITEDTNDSIQAIHTGSISLDFATGIGGIPIGRFTEIYGAESCGKTTLCLNISKQVVNSGKKVLYLDMEHGIDYSYVNAVVGELDKENFILVAPDLSDECFDIAEVGIRSGEFTLIVIDSLGNLVSKLERENPFEKDTMGRISRDLSKFLRRNSHAIRTSNTAFVFINQVRDKIGAYVPSVESPGGHALRHICSLRILLSNTGSKNSQITMGETAVGILVNLSIRKNKLAKPFMSAQFPIIWGEGIDSERDLVDFSENLGIIKRAGAYYRYMLDGVETNIGQGLPNTIAYLKEHKDVLDKIKEECYNVMKETRKLTEEDVKEGDEDEQNNRDETII